MKKLVTLFCLLTASFTVSAQTILGSQEDKDAIYASGNCESDSFSDARSCAATASKEILSFLLTAKMAKIESNLEVIDKLNLTSDLLDNLKPKVSVIYNSLRKKYLGLATVSLSKKEAVTDLRIWLAKNNKGSEAKLEQEILKY